MKNLLLLICSLVIIVSCYKDPYSSVKNHPSNWIRGSAPVFISSDDIVTFSFGPRPYLNIKMYNITEKLSDNLTDSRLVETVEAHLPNRNSLLISGWSSKKWTVKLYNIGSQKENDLLTIPGPTPTFCCISNDNEKFVYRFYEFDSTQGRYFSDLHLFDISSKTSSNLTNSPTDEGLASFSPSDDSIAFSFSLMGNAEIGLMDQEGQNFRILTPSDGIQKRRPIFSNSEREILYIGYSLGVKTSIFKLNLETRQIQEVLSESDDITNFRLSPNGEIICYSTQRLGDPDITLKFFDTSSGEKRVISTNIETFAISQNNQKVAFSRKDEEENEDIFLINLDGSNPINITKNLYY